MNVSPAKEIELLLQGGSARERALLAETESLLRRLAKVDHVSWLEDDEAPPPSSVQVAGDLKVMVPMAGLIDVEAESRRVTKEIDKLTRELKRVDGKLANENFLAKAPAAVVAKERDKGDAWRAQLRVLTQQLEDLKGL